MRRESMGRLTFITLLTFAVQAQSNKLALKKVQAMKYDADNAQEANWDAERGALSERPRPRTVFSKEVPLAVVNLIKNIIGSAVLSIPGGIAGIGGEPSLLLPSAVTLVTMASLSSYTFISVGRTCGLQKVSKYHEAYEKCFGERSKWVMTTSTIAYSTLACLTYAIIVGDCFSTLARGGILGTWLQANLYARDRRSWIVFFATAVFPLCTFKKLGHLSFTSLLGCLAKLYLTGFMVLRYLDGSYRPGGRFYASVLTPPSFSTGDICSSLKAFFSGGGVLILISQCASSFSPHANAPAYYESVGRNDAKFRLVSYLGYGLAILLNLVIVSSGFLTFGSSAAGVILNAYAENDPLAGVARILYGVSLIFSWPIQFAGLKPPLRSVLKRFTTLRKIIKTIHLSRNMMVTCFFMGVITAMALATDRADIVSSIRGVPLACSLAYVFPPLMYLRTRGSAMNRMERAGNYIFLTFGGVLMVLGLYKNILKIERGPSKTR
eukprot:gnl/MRDRNA2_/MRDRNA2_123712_c0_seq1.p1 gnl/MRDRNA2_/MRDRNA2_123712_c0~~gnl/MRDRNA2_/MRDRNA2_123712_c0_seq1.p1  ORF type:complete len:494 (+),score=37.35 gnl/MRDRNA2_/MRDRNA2_123712_c0_seq1:104-1585(+)